jgi:phosphoglycerate dehydrogenase-like enzyme
MQPKDPGYMPEGFGDSGGDLVRRLYPSQAIRSMLRECDFVVITVPLTPVTRDMVGSAELAAMKPGAYLVDISRGGVIDHSALIKALKEGRIQGAALDVFPEEPLPENSELWKMPNAVITPHISGVTPYYDERALELFAENLKRYLEDKPLYNLIDLGKGY